MQGTVVNKNFS